MDNTDKQLSFPQRNWFLLCVIVAVLSPLVVHWVQTGAHKQAYQQSVDIQSNDTSNRIANTPGSDTSAKKSPDSAAH